MVVPKTSLNGADDDEEIQVLGSKTEMAKVDDSIRLLSLEKLQANLAQAKITEKRMNQQIRQLMSKKDKAEKDPEFRVLDNQIKTEKKEIN